MNKIVEVSTVGGRCSYFEWILAAENISQYKKQAGSNRQQIGFLHKKQKEKGSAAKKPHCPQN